MRYVIKCGLPMLKKDDNIIAFKVNKEWFWGDPLNAFKSPWIWSKEFNKDIQNVDL